MPQLRMIAASLAMGWLLADLALAQLPAEPSLLQPPGPTKAIGRTRHSPAPTTQRRPTARPATARSQVRQVSQTASASATLPSRANDDQALDLPQRGQSDAKLPASGLPSTLAVFASLCFVIGLFLTVVWLIKRAQPAAGRRLPAEVLETLGHTTLGARQDAQLIRLGNKLLLVATVPGGMETLAEITDPVEVDRLAGLCRQAQADSSTGSFRQVFKQFGRQKAPAGFVGNPSQSTRRLATVDYTPREERHA